VDVGRGDRQSSEPRRQTGRRADVPKTMRSLIVKQSRAGLHVRRVELLARQQIEQAVAVEIKRRQTTPTISGGAGGAVGRYVGEPAAAVVAKQPAGGRHDALSYLSIIAVRTIRDVQIESPTVGEVNQERAAAVARSVQMRLAVEAKLSPVVAKE